jgi:hypothetical protein
MVMGKEGKTWLVYDKLTSHPQVHEPHPAIIETEVQILPPAFDLLDDPTS